ncbi:MAG: hypothetical protein P1V35_00310, partial [Planctomycetota bacterium]|nr:hypothetical protein [Planctomycetota bacterium]
MSSYNSVRLVDVNGRPDRSATSQPESDSARFPDPLADQQNAGRPEQAEEPSQRGSESVGETDPKQDSTTQQRKDQEKAKAEPEETEGKTIEVDSREDESREVNLSDGQAEVDPETVPSGSFGGEGTGGATEEQPIASELPALAELPQIAVDSSTGLQNQTITPGQMAQVATEASAPAAGLAPQVAIPKAPAGGNASAADYLARASLYQRL